MDVSEISGPKAIQERVASVVREDVCALRGYRVADAAGMVKLDAMENPHGLPQALRRELAELAAGVAYNRYPDASARELKSALRDYLQVPAGMELMLGNGSDEIIQILALACARPGAVLLGVEPSFAMFPLLAGACAMRFVGVPLAAGFALDEAQIIASVGRHRPALVFLAYPNNPTGNLFDAGAIERIVQAAPGLVVIDEAYHPFAQTSFLPRLHAYQNLLVMRTLSKLGLAGLRLGMLIGRPQWLEQFEKLRLPYNINALSQALAVRVLRSAEVLEAQAAEIRSERVRLSGALHKLPGVEVFDSAANFLLLRVPHAAQVFEQLLGHKIMVKSFAGAEPPLHDCLRITVGTAEENDAFLAAMSASTGGGA